MPKPPRTTRERWTQFLSFIAAWVVAATVGSALLFYFTADSDAPLEAEISDEELAAAPASEPAAAPPRPAPVVDDVAEESSPPAVAPASPPAPSPEPARARRATPPRSRAATRPVVSAEERSAKVATHVRAAATATEAGDYDTAIENYESALELDPNNFEVKILRDQVTSLRELESGGSNRRFQESRTELDVDGAPRPATDAELIIELLPAAPNPGDPYVLRVRAHNASNAGLSLASVELLETHDSMKHERGRATKPLAQRLGANETALLLEKRSDWSVADHSGAIVVAVTLTDGSRLSKSLRW